MCEDWRSIDEVDMRAYNRIKQLVACWMTTLEVPRKQEHLLHLLLILLVVGSSGLFPLIVPTRASYHLR